MRVVLVPSLPVPIPSWDDVTRMMEEDVDVGPGESAHLVKEEVTLTLPHAVCADLTNLALEAGWTLGQVASFLVLKGMAKVVREARNG